MWRPVKPETSFQTHGPRWMQQGPAIDQRIRGWRSFSGPPRRPQGCRSVAATMRPAFDGAQRSRGSTTARRVLLAGRMACQRFWRTAAGIELPPRREVLLRPGKCSGAALPHSTVVGHSRVRRAPELDLRDRTDGRALTAGGLVCVRISDAVEVYGRNGGHDIGRVTRHAESHAAAVRAAGRVDPLYVYAGCMLQVLDD
jgi:hypothetical protein